MANFTDGLAKLPYLDEKDLPLHGVLTPHGSITFLMIGETTEFRVRTLLTKEPETIRWIDSFESGDVFWDIGANIGCYSLYAASRKNIRIAAFEPSPVNFWLLSFNVVINNFSERIMLFPFGLADKTQVVRWHPNMLAGSADNQVSNCGGVSGLQTYQIDDLLSRNIVEFPQHIKLDVDGLERLILEGGIDALSNKQLKSILCEVDEGNSSETKAIVDLLISKGFSPPIKRHPPYFDDYHYAPMFNYLFTR